MKFVILLIAVAVVAVSAARPKSDCEKHRESAEKTGTIMKLIPKCKENGDYEELQCYKDSKFCVCYDKKGHAASPISTKLRECGCYLKRKQRIDSGHDNAYIPQCAEDGSWVKMQCWDYNDSCWCVDNDGDTETALSYHPHPLQRREAVLPKRGTLRPSGEFHDSTTHREDFPPKYTVPERPKKKVSKWKPKEGKFESDTIHKHDYRCPPPTEKAVACVPRPDMQKFQGPFRGESHYKHDYPPHPIQERQLPQWHPSFFPYRASSDPFAGETTYRADFEAPPEDVQQYPQTRPLKSNLTLPTGPMEKETTSMRDYRKWEGPLIAAKSFKPDICYQRPTEKFAGRTVTSTDYTPKRSETNPAAKQGDNLKPGRGPMEDMSLTMKDFQWLAVECPATYIKMFGRDALPQYEFEKTEGGHDYFKKLRQKKNAKKNLTSSKLMPTSQERRTACEPMKGSTHTRV